MTPLALSDAANEDVASSATSNTSKTRYTPSTTPEVANLSVVDGKKEKESKSTHNDASASVLNPEDYLPVGSLVLIKHEFGDISNLGLSDCAWTPINHVPGSSSKQTGKLVKDRWIHLSAKYCHFLDILAVRIYILPHDCGHRLVNRNIKKLQNVLARLLLRIDISREAWEGTVTNPFKRQSLCHARSSPSLFYIFNQLPSPAPEPSAVPNRYSRFAMQLLLEYDAPIAGQKTNLYRYQRRAIATMIERETSSKLVLDPRLVRVTSPASVDFFFDPVKLELFRSPRFFESYRGGILGESMGLGKTLIALSLILATKSHLPLVPSPYLPDDCGPREQVGSLVDMAKSTISRYSVPWQSYHDSLRELAGDGVESVVRIMREHTIRYGEPLATSLKGTRSTIQQLLSPRMKYKRLCKGTIIIIPRNLLSQWVHEIKKHFHDDALEILIMDRSKDKLPASCVLERYDLVIFTRNRFLRELTDLNGADERGEFNDLSYFLCGCPRMTEYEELTCRCGNDFMNLSSPLRYLHWLRVIVDEGHTFASRVAELVEAADKLITAERKWVITGTPLKDVIGAEVDLATATKATEVVFGDQVRSDLLQQRSKFNYDEDKGPISSLGTLVASFMKMEPWTGAQIEKRPSWTEYAYNYDDETRKKCIGLSACLTSTLNGIIVKTRPEDVENEIVLPQLTHEVIRLRPSLNDVFTANLFVLVLVSNALTSERTGTDYIFDKSSSKARASLVANLRESNFFWTGFAEENVEYAIESISRYLAKESTNCDKSDRKLATEAVELALPILSSSKWKAQGRMHDLGLFVERWPQPSRKGWSLAGDDDTDIIMTGIKQVLKAQSMFKSQLYLPLLTSSLATFENHMVQPDLTDARAQGSMDESMADFEAYLKTIDNDSNDSPSAKKNLTTQTSAPVIEDSRPSNGSEKSDSCSGELRRATNGVLDRPTKRPRIDENISTEKKIIDALGTVALVGTSSAKLSYILDQVTKHCDSEKMIIFYDIPTTAWYVGHALEVLNVKYHNYASNLSNQERSKNVAEFNEGPSIRVLLIHIQCGALGLNLNVASRIIFINPVCRPHIEAQAIKRAHRIGQTKPVHVQTLLLEGTIEEAMFERARSMTRTEHKNASRSLDDDEGIAKIIQNARPLSLDGWAKEELPDFAPLQYPRQIFGALYDGFGSL